MISTEDIEAFEDSTSYWTKGEEHYTTPMQMVKYFKDFTSQEGSPTLYKRLILEEYDEWLQEANNPNGHPTAEIKELADLVYVLYGYALSRGYNLDEALYRVHANNCMRVTQPDGTVKRREDGKVLKREDAPKVRLEDLV
jgi:hypothetical protein